MKIKRSKESQLLEAIIKHHGGSTEWAKKLSTKDKILSKQTVNEWKKAGRVAGRYRDSNHIERVAKLYDIPHHALNYWWAVRKFNKIMSWEEVVESCTFLNENVRKKLL